MSGTRHGPLTDLLGVVTLLLLSVATWWGWLGWDTAYDVDPVTGATTGPYEPWQVVGCALSLGAIAVAGGLLVRPWLVVMTMTVAFTAAWSISAAAHDGSGLWVIGAFLVLFGTAAGTAGCAFVARAISGAARRRRRAPVPS